MTIVQTLHQRVRQLDKLLVACVIMPTLLAILYFGFIASDEYVSESQFIVRSPEKPAMTGMGVLLKTAGFTGGGDEIYAAQDYVKSRDALRAINRSDLFRNAYASHAISIFDRFDGFGFSGTFEDLYQYYGNKIRVEHDSTSGVTTLRVRGFTPVDAERFNHSLLQLAESTVNHMSERGRTDLIRTAQAEVETAKRRASTAALALSSYRNRHGVVDPEKQAAVQMQMISKIQDELIATQVQLAQLRSYAPSNPQIGALRAKITDLRDAIEEQLRKVAGDQQSLSSTAAQYQHLALESQFADKQLAAAMATLIDAQNEANRKHAYVERIVQPNRPDKPTEPKRWRGILATLVLGLVAWGIVRMLVAGIREHQD